MDLLDAAMELPDLPAVLSFPPVSIAADDDFGDFTQAEETTNITETDPAPQEEPCEAVQHIEAPVESAQVTWNEPDQCDDDLPAVREEPEGCQEADFGDFSAADSVPAQNEQPEETAQVDDDEDEFGDFGVAEEADDFDDFEAAPPAEATSTQLTPEAKIQQVFASLFPQVDLEREADAPPSPLKSRAGPIWSYASQLDSTPALSFSWRHSTAHQRYLSALRIDSVLQPMVWPSQNVFRLSFVSSFLSFRAGPGATVGRLRWPAIRPA